MYHQFEDHPFHEKRNEAMECQAEYQKLTLNDIQTASYLSKLIRIKPLSDKHQRATLFLDDIESISKGLIEKKME
jgi:hypothetical protein